MPYVFTGLSLVVLGDFPSVTKVVSFFLEFFDLLAHFLDLRMARGDHLTALLNRILKLLVAFGVDRHLRAETQLRRR